MKKERFTIVKKGTDTHYDTYEEKISIKQLGENTGHKRVFRNDYKKTIPKNLRGVSLSIILFSLHGVTGVRFSGRHKKTAPKKPLSGTVNLITRAKRPAQM